MSGPFAYSAGTAAASTVLPPGACDCHIHVYDARVPAVAGAQLHPPDASMADYRGVQQRMGTQRAVVVTPSTYGADNRPMLAGLQELGKQGRGVAVITGDESTDALQTLHAHGVRGVRINLSLGTLHQSHDIAKIARRIEPLGWHLQLLMPLDQLATLGSQLRGLPVDLVFDHFGRVTPGLCGQHPAHTLLLELLQARRAWVKLSGGYLVSPTSRSDDPQLLPLARSFIDPAPDRVVWGSDWPHATASAGRHPMPDDAAQVDALARWAGDAHLLRQILVSNPEQLYGFTPVTSH
ncbi:MAG: amidohydrolase [Limnohabitans sp.]|nr:MAG: amidohydrolase [Limnohabitans sp.]